MPREFYSSPRSRVVSKSPEVQRITEQLAQAKRLPNPEDDTFTNQDKENIQAQVTRMTNQG